MRRRWLAPDRVTRSRSIDRYPTAIRAKLEKLLPHFVVAVCGRGLPEHGRAPPLLLERRRRERTTPAGRIRGCCTGAHLIAKSAWARACRAQSDCWTRSADPASLHPADWGRAPSRQGMRSFRGDRRAAARPLRHYSSATSALHLAASRRVVVMALSAASALADLIRRDARACVAQIGHGRPGDCVSRRRLGKCGKELG